VVSTAVECKEGDTEKGPNFEEVRTKVEEGYFDEAMQKLRKRQAELEGDIKRLQVEQAGEKAGGAGGGAAAAPEVGAGGAAGGGAAGGAAGTAEDGGEGGGEGVGSTADELKKSIFKVKEGAGAEGGAEEQGVQQRLEATLENLVLVSEEMHKVGHLLITIPHPLSNPTHPLQSHTPSLIPPLSHNPNPPFDHSWKRLQGKPSISTASKTRPLLHSLQPQQRPRTRR
jgi:hypothetical protein